MKFKTFVSLSTLFICLPLQAKSVFVYDPDWEKLATTIARDESLLSAIKDPRLVDTLKKITRSQDFQQRAEEIDEFIKSSEGRKFVEELKSSKDLIINELQYPVTESLKTLTGANCSSQSCVFRDFSMQIGSKTLKADTYEVPIVNGKIDLRRGTATNTVLADPKSGDLSLGTSTINANKLQDGFELNIGASHLNHQKKDVNGRDTSLLSVPSGVQIQAKIDQSTGSDQFQIVAESASGITYRQTPHNNEKMTFETSSPIKLSIELNGSTDQKKIYLGTNDPNSTISLRHEKGRNVLDAKLQGETYFLVDGEQKLLVSKQVHVDDQKSQGVVDNLEIRSNGSTLSGQLGRVEFKNISSQINVEDFSFVKDNQTQSFNSSVSKTQGHYQNINFKGRDIQVQSQDGKIHAMSFELN